MSHTRRAVTQVELLVVLVCTVLLLTVCSAVLAGDGNGARTKVRSLKDATHIKQIHQCLLIYANDSNGHYLRPGLVDRLADPHTGRHLPGAGPEDLTANTTANMYSAFVAMNFFNPDLPISPIERNPGVTEDEDYDWEQYDPRNDTYWDHKFTANLETGSNASYAHLVIHGERAKKYWRHVTEPMFVIMGNRGPLSGEPDGGSYTCGPHGHWAGNVVFNDNHTEMTETFTPANQAKRHVGEEEQPDNIFRMEDGPNGADAILSFTQAIDDDGPALQHD